MTSLSVVAGGDRRGDRQRRKTDAVDRLFDLSLDMLGTASVEGYFTRLNPSWERRLGWTVQQLMSEPFISFVHPDDVTATQEQSAKARRAGGRDSGRV